MWLQASRKQHVVRFDPSDHVVAWTIDVKAFEEVLLTGDHDPDEFVIGRLLADEIRLREIEACGENIWDVADADSSGLEAAWASLLDERGQLRSAEFERPIDSVVYLYRFALHADFSACRLTVLDAVCRIFGTDTVILAQHHTTWFADTEFELLGFHLLPPSRMPAPAGFPNIDRDIRFMVRHNAMPREFSLTDYPEDINSATAAHAQWVESKGPWSDLV